MIFPGGWNSKGSSGTKELGCRRADGRREHLLLLAPVLLLLLALTTGARAQQAEADRRPAAAPMALRTEAVGPNRFVAVHGRRSLIMGYPQAGLEIWGYPFQILSGYQIGFRSAGSTAEVDARLLLRSIEYRPDAVTRTYIGPDYLVREKLFVPLDEAGVAISYEVEGSRQVEIQVHFVPVMNLMWPGALGGQYTRWLDRSSEPGGIAGFVITEPERGTSAMIGSPELVTHDDAGNSTIRPEDGFSFAMRPSVPPGAQAEAVARSTVIVALNPAGTRDAAAALRGIASRLRTLESEAEAHYTALASNSLRIRTPDESVNQGLAWAVAALDQAWVCNQMLGCGMVAGYGPSRDQRRPQYAWFFGGDGLVATNALISAGEYTRASEELSFIQKYQEPRTGMIWHELSQSAGYIDWSKYPYMYVHVDISFDYLITLSRYVAESGDTAFAREHWASIAAAYRYCQSLIDRGDHLPHIPADKEAADEQHRPADDLGLSANWINAADSFAALAKVTGHTQEVAPALHAAELARRSIPARYWSSEKNFWLTGHTQSGEAIFRRSAGPTQLLLEDVFSTEQKEALLHQLTSAEFQADWGTRGLAAASPEYNPYSYGAGSISALGSTAVAATLWKAHQPASALALWNGIMQWSSFDSLGHIHEVLAGNFYQEQTESVPEQTWSSAGLLDATVRGLLGLTIDGAVNRLELAPHVPAEWPRISVDNVHLPHSTLALTISQGPDAMDLDISNDGAAATMLFKPEIPLGAQLLGAEMQGHAVEAEAEIFPGDEHARLTLNVPPGASHCHLSFRGGLRIELNHPVLHPGDRSSQLKVVEVHLAARVLTIEADVHPDGDRSLRILTPWKILSAEGATVGPRP